MLIRALVIAACLAMLGGGAFAQGYNPSNVGQALVTDCSVVIASTGTPQQVLAQSGASGGIVGNRRKIILQNVPATAGHTLGFSFTMGSSLAITSSQQYVLQPFATWTSDADLIPMNQIEVVGQVNDILVCTVSGTP